ncbi:hypothetical protein HU200_029528 [Digitaria exilis]|uniref:Uncharacterized protein n=1 Tax=Digitaria exilis TaxID=1010633 RepID=A0A835BPS3_9POAL|nr:hypothetical protein HU200_029528 [Digitaria exilis]
MGIVPQQLPANNYRRLKRWVFDGKAMNVPQLVALIKQDIHNWHTAHNLWEE